MICDSDLVEFANNLSNDIKICECDLNAIKVHKRFGGRIIFGNAVYTSDKSPLPHPHFWNLVLGEDGEIVKIIDIINFKYGDHGRYIEHKMLAEMSLKELEGLAKER